MRVLIGGGSGFIGRHLEKALRQRGHTVQLISRTNGPQRVTWNEIRTEQKLPECDALVNLSGEYILNPFRFWNENYKKDVYDSRIGTNQLLVDVMSKSKTNCFSQESSLYKFSFLVKSRLKFRQKSRIPLGHHVSIFTLYYIKI